MRSYKTEGIIIKRSNFGEADRILTVFTKRYGKIKIIAKGVRRITSRRGPNVELFNLVTLFVHRGRTFDILTEAQVIDTFSHFRKNLNLVGLAYYVAELIDGLCAEHQPHPSVYHLSVSTLEELDHKLIQQFETTLLFELGFLPPRIVKGVTIRDRNSYDDSVLSKLNTTTYIEHILERRLKTKRLLARFAR